MAQIAPGPPPEARRPTTTPATTPVGTALVAAAEGSVAALEAFAAAEGALDERRLEAIAARLSTIARRRRAPADGGGAEESEPAASANGKEAQRKAHRRLLIERFKALDADADGEVDADEFAAGVASTEPGGLTLREAKALFRSVDENGDGTMDQMEFISLMESRHPLLRRVAWAAEIQDALGGGGDDDGGIWVDPNATHVGMISPHGRFRVGWDLATALLLVYVAVIEPLRLGWPSYFASENGEGDVQGASKPPLVNALDWITDVFFIADLALNFRTGYVRRETGAVDLDPARSRRHYLATWFALDFVSSVPPIFGWVTYLVAAGSGGNLSPLRSVKLVRLLRIMKLMKMLRLAKFLRFRNEDGALAEFCEDFFASSYSKALRRTANVLVAFMVLAHYLGCLFSVAGRQHLTAYYPRQRLARAPAPDDDAAAARRALADATRGTPYGGAPADAWSVRRQYLAAVYWAITTMTTVGYGDVVPITDSERAFTIFAMIVGGGFYGYVVAQATRVVADFDAQRGPYYQKMDTLRSWLTYHQVPLHVRRHVRRYYRTYFSHRTAFDERAIIDDLDPVSREKIADHVLPSCIRHNDLFGVLPRGALCKLIDVVRLVHFRAGEPLVAEGDRCGSMFVLYSGKVRVKRCGDDGRAEATEETLQPGGSFGQPAALGIDSRSRVSARAVAPSKVYVIPQDALLASFASLPEALHAMRQHVDPGWRLTY